MVVLSVSYAPFKATSIHNENTIRIAWLVRNMKHEIEHKIFQKRSIKIFYLAQQINIVNDN